MVVFRPGGLPGKSFCSPVFRISNENSAVEIFDDTGSKEWITSVNAILSFELLTRNNNKTSGYSLFSVSAIISCRIIEKIQPRIYNICEYVAKTKDLQCCCLSKMFYLNYLQFVLNGAFAISLYFVLFVTIVIFYI
jgi:hypothetical protein